MKETIQRIVAWFNKIRITVLAVLGVLAAVIATVINVLQGVGPSGPSVPAGQAEPPAVTITVTGQAQAPAQDTNENPPVGEVIDWVLGEVKDNHSE